MTVPGSNQNSDKRPGGMRRLVILSVLGVISLRCSFAFSQSVTLSHLYTALPAITNDTVAHAGSFGVSGQPLTGMLTVELEDDFDAVQIGIETTAKQSWQLARLAVAPSASYGPDPVVGEAAYDLDGSPIEQLLPVQWSNGGANSSPPGNAVLSLTTSSATTGGQTVLPLTRTSTSGAYGNVQPAAGWYAADGLGCIAAGTTVQSITSTSVTLSTGLRSGGCASGQSVYFSPVPFGPSAYAVPAAPHADNVSFSFSDWVPIASLPRTDGGYAPGAAVSAAGVASGTSIATVDPADLVLTQALLADLPAHSPVAVSTSQTSSGDTPSGSVSVTVSATQGVRPGQTVSGSGAIPAHTHVAAVTGNVITLDQPTSALLPDGSALSFSNTVWTTLPAKAGDTVLHVPSTSARPLLHLRYQIAAGSAPTVHLPGCGRVSTSDTIQCEAPLNLPQVWSSIGGVGPGGAPLDGINFVSSIGNGAGGATSKIAYPTFFVRFHGRHAGTTLLICGGFQSAGALGSVSGEAGPGRVGAAWASRLYPANPISVVSAASAHFSTDTDFQNCTSMIQGLSPGMVLIQNYSNHNGAQIDTYRAQVQAAAESAVRAGVQPIIYLAYVENSYDVGGLVSARAVTNSTDIPLTTGTNAAIAGVPTPLIGTGIPAGTLAMPVAGSWDLNVSQPVTLPAGTLLHLVLFVGSVGSNSIGLTTPAYLSPNSLTMTIPRLQQDFPITLKRGSMIAATPAASYIVPGTYLRLHHGIPSVTQNYVAAAQWYANATDTWDNVRLDGLDILGHDPNNQYWLCNACSTIGPYANDYGNGFIAQSFVATLEQLIGSAVQPTN